MATRAISITIDEVLAEKLARIADETHRKKSYLVNRALEEFFEEIEDLELAHDRRGGKATPLNQAKRELGI